MKKKLNIKIYQIIKGAIKLTNPEDIYFVYIDNWFDSKWLGFSGKVLGAAGKWKGNTIPPFNRNRISGGSHLRLANGIYERIEDNLAIHQNWSSSDNLNNKLSRHSKNGLFAWIGENNKINEFGSLMVYNHQENEENWQWYASFKQKTEDEWFIHKSVGLNKKEILDLESMGKYNLKTKNL